jgi:hypothetical protein
MSHPAVTCMIPATDGLAHLVDDLKAEYRSMPDATAWRCAGRVLGLDVSCGLAEASAGER